MDMNINILSNSEVQTLNEIIENAQNIVICCHKSPDGDALGSSLGWANFLSSCGKESNQNQFQKDLLTDYDA